MKWNATKPPLESEWAIYDAADGTCRIADSIEDEGHARVMAAAPELLGALNGLLRQLEAQPSTLATADAMEAAYNAVLNVKGDRVS